MISISIEKLFALVDEKIKNLDRIECEKIPKSWVQAHKEEIISDLKKIINDIDQYHSKDTLIKKLDHLKEKYTS